MCACVRKANALVRGALALWWQSETGLATNPDPSYTAMQSLMCSGGARSCVGAWGCFLRCCPQLAVRVRYARRAVELPDARSVTALVGGVSRITDCVRMFLPAVGVLLSADAAALERIGGSLATFTQVAQHFYSCTCPPYEKLALLLQAKDRVGWTCADDTTVYFLYGMDSVSDW